MQKKCVWKNSPSQALPRQLPRRGSQAVKLIAKVICVMGKLLAQAQSLRARQRLPLRGSWQNRQVLTEGVQTVTPSVSLCSASPPRGRLCTAAAKFPATAEAVPLGKVAAPQAMTEGVQQTKTFPPRRRFRRKQARQLPFAVTTPSREKRVSEKSADFSETQNLK